MLYTDKHVHRTADRNDRIRVSGFDELSGEYVSEWGGDGDDANIHFVLLKAREDVLDMPLCFVASLSKHQRSRKAFSEPSSGLGRASNQADSMIAKSLRRDGLEQPV